MKVICPHCQQHYELDEYYAGKMVNCDVCGSCFTVPDEANTPSETPESQLIEEPVSESAPEADSLRCPFCGGKLFPGAKKCRHCGEWVPLKQDKAPVKLSRFIWLGVGGLALFAILVLFTNIMYFSAIYLAIMNITLLLSILFILIGMCKMAGTPYQTDGVPKNRLIYILLALAGGVLGLHNFYAGYKIRGLVALLLTATVFGIIFSVMMELYDIINVTHDAAGIRFKE